MKLLSKEEFKKEFNKFENKFGYSQQVTRMVVYFVTYPNEETIAMRESDIES
jgi:hypothetical protein